jgi:hypothetical protein
VEQTAASSRASVRADTLSLPLKRRRTQLVQPGGPIEALQLRAQKVALELYITFAGSIGASYASYLAEYIETGTSVGMGLLGIAVAGWRAQSRWLKAQRRFWGDWKRVEEGLTADLEATKKSAVELVLATPKAAEQVLLEMVDTKRRETEEMRRRLEGLRKSFDEVANV